MLFPEIAEKIVKDVKRLINEDIIVVNTEGIIIASTEHKRIGAFHQGALLAAERKEKIVITEEDQKTLIGVKAGINLPVFFLRDVIGVIGITGDPAKVSPFGELIRKMTEMIVSENYYSEQLELQSRTLEAFVFDWIQKREWDSVFLHRAKLLNVNLTFNRQAIMIELHKYEHLNHRYIYSSFSKWHSTNADDIFIRWGNNRVLILRGSPDKETRDQVMSYITAFQTFFEEHLHTPMSIGIGQKVSSHEIKISYDQAERALRSTSKQNNIVFDEDLTIEMILDEVRYDTKTIFVKRTIGPIVGDEELLLTVQTLFEQNHSLKRTASALHIHINTLHYRLRKVYELTKLDPSNIHDLLILFLSLQLLDETTKKRPI
ncbi:CdaR family transcriptional regulator [Bacillus sp. 1NLA3E]|uniref:CdaR family transcriptional regulator n=1 Tax=Bacillus sp. 1NLA3E TaxID=666686 RepID=UPI000247F1EB|nr:sugar diacid recognition domain-containing protein [Bacillus sp. 1NLA3E]AGK52804.1 Sugar diacid utilization regulator [Bacillus sp. 1NLA3E]